MNDNFWNGFEKRAGSISIKRLARMEKSLGRKGWPEGPLNEAVTRLTNAKDIKSVFKRKGALSGQADEGLLDMYDSYISRRRR